MSLDWSIENVDNYKETCWDTDEATGKHKLNWKLEVLIWAALSIDVGTLTDKTIDEWEWRIKFMKQCGMDSLGWFTDKEGNKKDYWPSRNDLEKFKGLTTNVSTVTRTKWINETVKIVKRYAENFVTLDGDGE